MVELQEEQSNKTMQTLRNVKSRNVGGPSGIVNLPYRVTLRPENDNWALQPSEIGECVFCHNDLSQQNIIVDPDTLKINAIIGREYCLLLRLL